MAKVKNNVCALKVWSSKLQNCVVILLLTGRIYQMDRKSLYMH